VAWSIIGVRRVRSATWKKIWWWKMMEEMWADRDRLESNITRRFRAHETGDKVTTGVMESEGFSILESCLEKPISKNSVSEGLSIRRSADILEETSAIALYWKETYSRKLLKQKEMKSRLSSAYRWWWTEDLEMMVLRGVV
jgi:hypothetical protein